MGAKESKPPCISYDEAIKRVSDLELRRIKETFKAISGQGGSYITQSAFQQDVLCEGAPQFISEWLFVACGGTQKGISLRDLLCGLVLLTRGTEDEKIRFLWNLYSNDSATYISKSDYAKALQLETTISQKDLADAGLINTSLLSSLFQQSDRVNFEQFKNWIVHHKKATVLSKWLLSDTTVGLTSELEAPTFYQSLAGVTHLDEKDIGDLEKVFWSLKNTSKNGQLDLESLGLLICPPIPQDALEGVFWAFDENRDGHIDFKELCCGVSAACRGPSVERSKFCFKVFDIDRDGVLNYNEVKQMIDILALVAKESGNSNEFRAPTSNDVFNDLVRFSRKSSPIINGLKKDVMKEIGKHTDCGDIVQFNLTQEDFMMWSVESTLNIVQPFLDLFFDVCHIVLGLRPQCRHLESKIVKRWLLREERRGYKVGQFWYLISSEWWHIWLQNTQNTSSLLCPYCKSSPTGIKGFIGVDEATVCDESFTSNSTESMGDLLSGADSSSLGSGSSGVSCGRQNSGPPGPIDNSNLIAPDLYKNIPTLTGEGGRLKRDTPLAQHRDFELVPDSLWTALSQWYGARLQLPRQVIKPPNSPDVEVELYPLSVHILRHQNTQQINQSAAAAWGAVSVGYGVITSGSNYTTMTAVPQIMQPPKRYLAHTAAFSRLATIKQVGEFLCKHLKLKMEDIRLWHILSQGNLSLQEAACLLEEETMSLQELDISDNDQILLEIRNKDLTWPEELGSLTTSNSVLQERRLTTTSIQSPHVPGATGLHNLGNTCFMNSALQVLFNTRPLTEYFLESMHLYELNTENKLGTKGQLALRYADLLKEVWTATTRSIAPLKLRFCVTKYAPQFAGGGQHDSQELLEWLLDALHEDLNRVTEKPYTELKDSNGRPDEVVASEAWAQHHARNQSVVIDLFYGQLKSKVSCLCCGRESVRFDPYSLLSLPLPVENYTYCEVTVILLDGTVPVKYGLRLNSEAKYSDLKKELATLCHLCPNRMLVCELSNSQIKCIFYDDQKIKLANATDIHVYQLPEGGEENRSRTSSIIGINIEKGLKDIQRTPALLIAADHTLPSLEGQVSITSTNESPPHSMKTPSEKSFGNQNSDGGYYLSSPNSTKDMSCNMNRRTSKQSDEISASPESIFSSVNRKRISMTNLLNDNTQSCNNSSDELNSEKNMNDVIDQQYRNEKSILDAMRDCPCKSITDNDDDDEYISENIQPNTSKSSYFGLSSQNPSIGGYIVAVHRKLTRQDSYFLSYHKTRPSLFGVPLLIPCYENGTNKDLYCAVWMQVARLLSPLPPTPPDQANHATDCDDSLGYEFPFTLRAVAEGGGICALCPWTNFCRGCEIPCNDDLLLHGAFTLPSVTSSNSSTPKLSSRDSPSPQLNRSKTSTPTKSLNSNFYSAINIAIDWDPTALHLRYQSTREKIWTEHESVKICRKLQTEPIDLYHCLKAFTTEEKLEQWYHCSHCKGKKPATKKLQIWKLPPVLIIHLKRFNYVNDKWVKSQKVVNFPFEDFDPTPFLASVPQETILRHKELLELRENNMKNAKESFMTNPNSLEPKIIEKDINGSNEKLEENSFKTNKEETDKEQSNNNIENKISSSRNLSNESLQRRKRLISTSLTKSPIIDGDFRDFHEHKLKTGEDPFELNYQLYAVVSHSGMLNGGHYVSYASNRNGSWYCYNDSSCREVPSRPNIDPSSAYLLFYERRGLDYSPYMPNVEGRIALNSTNIEGEGDGDSDFKKPCVIS